PEPLAPSDLSDRAVGPCNGDDPGWQVDLPFSGTVSIHVGPTWQAAVTSPLARMRLSRERACVERVVGAVDAYAAVVPEPLVHFPRASATLPRDSHAIDVALVSARTRIAVRCAAR
ncbi:MAG TPA: hypothetical protein VIJ22_11160, partial [Polyangiaceae bacterium]